MDGHTVEQGDRVVRALGGHFQVEGGEDNQDFGHRNIRRRDEKFM